MKAEIQIPDGWQKLETGKVLREGDLVFNGEFVIWYPVESAGVADSHHIYIRKVRP